MAAVCFRRIFDWQQLRQFSWARFSKNRFAFFSLSLSIHNTRWEKSHRTELMLFKNFRYYSGSFFCLSPWFVVTLSVITNLQISVFELTAPVMNLCRAEPFLPNVFTNFRWVQPNLWTARRRSWITLVYFHDKATLCCCGSIVSDRTQSILD